MHLFEAASTADAGARPRCSSAPVTERSSGSPTRTRRTLRPSAQALELADAEDDRSRFCSPAATRSCARASPKRREQHSPRPVRWRSERAIALLGQAALGFAGLGIAIVDLDAEAVARLEEALERVADPALRSRVQARLAVELYYAPDRTRSDRHSADAVATARASGDTGALASALSARHVALWRPDRIEERLSVAGEMIPPPRVPATATPSCKPATGASQTCSSSAR